MPASSTSKSRAQQERSPSLFDPDNDPADASPSATTPSSATPGATSANGGGIGAEEDAQAIKRRRGLEAQRAFRKRKAAHLQDLERKVALYEVENAQLKGENGRLKEENHWLRRQLGEAQEGGITSATNNVDNPNNIDTTASAQAASAATAAGTSKKRKSSMDGSASDDDNTSSTTSTIQHALQHALHGTNRTGEGLPSVMMPSPSRAASLASILQAAEHADAYPQHEQRPPSQGSAHEKTNNGRHAKRQAISSSQGGRTTLPPIPAMPIMDESSPYYHQQHNRLPPPSFPSSLTPLLLSPGRSCDSPPSLPLPNPTHLSQHTQERPIHYNSQRQHYNNQQGRTSPPLTYPSSVLRGGASGATYLPSSRRSSGEDYVATGRDTSRTATPSLSYSSFPSNSACSTNASQSLSSYPDSNTFHLHQHQGLPTPLSSALLPASSASKAACCNGIIDCPDLPEANDGKYRDRRRSESIMRPESSYQGYVDPAEGNERGDIELASAGEKGAAAASPKEVLDTDRASKTLDAASSLHEADKDTEIKPRISDERSSSASSTQ